MKSLYHVTDTTAMMTREVWATTPQEALTLVYGAARPAGVLVTATQAHEGDRERPVKPGDEVKEPYPCTWHWINMFHLR